MDHAILAATRYAGTRLPHMPRLAPWLLRVDLGDGWIQLRAPGFTHTLGHPLLVQVFDAVAPLLDGAHDVEAIARAAGPGIEPTTVVFLLQQLQAHGVLHEGALPAGTAALELAAWERQVRFFGHLTANPLGVQAALARAGVAVLGGGGLTAAVATALGEVGIGQVVAIDDLARDDALIDTHLLVACVESEDDRVFVDTNEACLERGVRWLRLAIEGSRAHLGPTIVPRQTACYRCYQLRVRSHLPDPEETAAYHARLAATGAPDDGACLPFVHALAAQAALEAARMLGGFAPPVTIGAFFELDLRSPATTRHDVLKVPRCPSCGTTLAPREAWNQADAAGPGWS